jgi:hypothetical protein
MTRPTIPTTSALRSSAVRARSAAGTTSPWGREPESVDNTRGKRAAVDNVRNPPVSARPFSSGKSYFPHILLRRGTAGHSSLQQERPTRPDRPSEGRGNDSIHHSDDDGSTKAEQRDPQGSVSRASCPQIFDNVPGRRLDTPLSTHECQCRDRPTATPITQAGRAARPGNGRERFVPPRCRCSYTAGELWPRPAPTLRTAADRGPGPAASKPGERRPVRMGDTTPP